MDIIKQMQTNVAPSIFTPRAVYDGRKNMFAIRELPFGETHSHEVSVGVLKATLIADFLTFIV